LSAAIGQKFPGVRQVGVDVDGELVDFCRRSFGIPRKQDIKARIADATQEVLNFAPGSLSLIVRDIFTADGGVPAAVRDPEFLANTLSLLAPGGVYIANFADVKDVSNNLSAELTATKRAVKLLQERVADTEQPPTLRISHEQVGKAKPRELVNSLIIVRRGHL
jgi:spermidine synthase